jgi:hypothetical protein
MENRTKAIVAIILILAVSFSVAGIKVLYDNYQEFLKTHTLVHKSQDYLVTDKRVYTYTTTMYLHTGSGTYTAYPDYSNGACIPITTLHHNYYITLDVYGEISLSEFDYDNYRVGDIYMRYWDEWVENK